MNKNAVISAELLNHQLFLFAYHSFQGYAQK